MTLHPTLNWKYDVPIVTPAVASSYPRLLAQLYARRGYHTLESIQSHFRLSIWHDPSLLPDIDKLVAFIDQLKARKGKLYLFTDYDADGGMSGYIMASFLQSLGIKIVWGQADRFSGGYGIQPKHIYHAASKQVDGILTLDCGTNDVDAMNVAVNTYGLPVFVLDHHLLQETLPESVVVVNPHREDSKYPFKMLCTGALSFKVVSLLAKRYNIPRETVAEYLPFAGIALLADQMPMIDEAYAITWHALSALPNTTNVGLRTLMTKLEMIPPSNERTVHFGLGPLFNAPGRLGSASIVVRLLVEKDEQKAAEIADRLIAINEERKVQTEEAVERCVSELGPAPKAGIIISGGKGLNHGVAGIASAKLVEKYHRPVVVFGESPDGMLVGSGRSVPGFSILNALTAVREHCERLGGHDGACGVTIRPEALETIQQAFLKTTRPESGETDVEIDLSLSLPEIDEYLEEVVPRFHPCGLEHEAPILMFRNLQLIKCYEKFETPGVFRLRLTDGENFINAKTTMNLGPYISQKVDVIARLNAGIAFGKPFRLLEVIDICTSEARQTAI